MTMLLGFLIAPNPAFADCANPAGPEGRLVYNSTHKVVQYCDGTNWIGMGGGGGGGGSSSLVGLSDVDAGAAGDGDILQYNSTTTNWEAVPLPAGVAGTDTQVQFNDGGATLAGAAHLLWNKTDNRLTVGSTTPGGYTVDVTGKAAASGLIYKSVSGAAAPLSGSTYWSSDGTNVWRATGNVGIGTAAPSAKLQVLGGVSLQSTLAKATFNNYDNDVSTSFNITGAAGSDTRLLSIHASVSGTQGSAVGGNIFAVYGHNGTSFVHGLTVTNDGKIGIGTTSPATKLHVLSSLNDGIRVTDGTRQGFLGPSGWGGIALAVQTNHDFDIATNDTQRLKITASGNVGIGTSSPSQALDVVGKMTIHPSGTGADNAYNGNLIVTKPSASGQYINLIRSGSYPWSIGMVYNTANFAIGTGMGTDSNFTAPEFVLTAGSGNLTITGQGYKPGGGDWTASSDARLKDIDGDYDAGLASIVRLNPVRFHYKKDNPRREPSDRQFVGLIAQDVQKIFPEAVTERDDGYLDLDTTPINFALINAIKDLKAANDNHAATIEALRASNKKLEELNASVMKRLDALEAHGMH